MSFQSPTACLLVGRSWPWTFTVGVALVAILAAAPADAGRYLFSIDDPSGSARAGDIRNVSTSWNEDTNVFSWSSTIDRHNGRLADAFWLVVSDGPNPKSLHNEYAILYGDVVNNRLTAYVYNGVNSSSSWHTPGEFIEAFAGVLDVDESNDGNRRTISIAMDASTINGYTPTQPGVNDWDGLLFGERVGIWFHPLVLGNATYDASGGLTAFNYSGSGWYDTANRSASYDVPAPASAFLFLAFGALAVARRQRAPIRSLAA